MKTFASLFTGFGGADLGAMAAGLDPIWGVEYDPQIAAVASANLDHRAIVDDVLNVDPAGLPAPDFLHASPPCPSFSVAKTNGKETDLDRALAGQVARFVDVLRPRVFTLENVWGYRNSASWATIRDALYSAGYWLTVDHVNAADLGVPQSRRRMIVRAVLGGWVPYLPPPVPHVGWYAAIADLIPTLPASKLARWQMERLPDDLRKSILIGSNKTEWGDGFVEDGDPAFSITTQWLGRARAVLVGNSANATSGAPIWKEADRPVDTPRTADGGGRALHAVLIDGGQGRAGTQNVSCVQAADPALTATELKGHHRAVIGSRVLKITPRCLARFQTFPDWYDLPDSQRIAGRGLGNAVPALMMQRITEGLIGGTQ